MDEQGLFSADKIQELLTKHANEKKKINSHIHADKNGGRIFKVCNLQALINNTWKHTADEGLMGTFGPITNEHVKATENEKEDLEFVNLRVNSNNQVSY